MNSRIPLISAVVGALLVGGATTGATHASWTSQRHLQAHQVSAGSMSFTATSPGAVTVNKVSGSTAETSFVLDDTSAGKNLQQRITTTVGSSPAGVTTTVGTSCSTTGASAVVDTTPTSANQTVCVKVTSSPTAVSGTVTLHISGTQRPTGWSTPVLTRTFAVTVNSGAAPSAPAIVCGTSTNNSHTFTWAPIVGASGYNVHRSNSTNADASYSVATNVLTPTYVAPLSGNQTSFFRVKAVSATGLESAYSNTLRIVRSGSNVTCTPVTP
jgi:hypothetical protein